MRSLCLVCLLAMLGTLTLAQTNPVPFINQPLVPDATAPGGKGFTLTVNGTGFVSGSVVNWNGSPLATTFVSGSQLTASVPASYISKAGTASVTVFNPNPGGGTSNVVFFGVHVPMPVGLGRVDYPTGTNPHSAITADFNGDGKLDLVTADRTDNTVSVLLGNSGGTFQSRTPYATASGPLELATGDFDGDGILDLAVTDQQSNAVSILLGNGDGTFKTHVEFATGNEPLSVTAGDFNQDGKLDLAVTNGSDNTVSVLLGNGNGTFQPQVPYATGARPFPLVTGDFNGDGVLDLAVGNQNDNSVSILLGKGDGTFQPQITYAAGSQVYALTTADLNGDGKLDLAAANNADSTVSVLLGFGDGTFQPQATLATGSAPGSVITGDFNRDGKLDLATANEGGNSASVLLGNGDGTFQAHVDYGAGSSAHSVVAGDFNQDGRLDLAVANYNDSTISAMLQDGTVTLLPPSLNFGVQLVGTRTAQKVVLTNIGSKTLNISSITITGIDTRDFGEHDNCGSSLPPKAHCTINVTFKPTKLGPRTAAVTITDDAPGSPQSVPLSGIGATSGPNATLSTHSLTFAAQLLHTSSPPQPVTLSNYGTKTLDITSIVASPSVFTQTNNCDSSLPPGGSCTVNVTFTPTQRGQQTGTLSVTDNAPGSPQKVSLKGAGTVVKLDPASLDFGRVTVGQKSSPQNTMLTNVGKTRLHITGITITGTDSGDFSQKSDCPNPGYLGGGKSCTITATFQPTQVGSRSADVSISDDGGGSPQLVSLSGIGIANCFGECGIVCRSRHCGCVFGRCAAVPTGSLDLLWDKEKAREFQCAVRPVIGFGCQQ